MTFFGKPVSGARNVGRVLSQLVNFYPSTNVNIHGQNISHTIYQSDQVTTLTVTDFNGVEIAKYDVSFLDGSFKVVESNNKKGLLGRLGVTKKTIALDEFSDNHITIKRENNKLQVQMALPEISESQPHGVIRLSDQQSVLVKSYFAEVVIKRDGNNYSLCRQDPDGISTFEPIVLKDGGEVVVGDEMEIRREGSKIELSHTTYEEVELGEEDLEDIEFVQSKVQIDTQYGIALAQESRIHELTQEEIADLKMPIIPAEETTQQTSPFEYIDLTRTTDGIEDAAPPKDRQETQIVVTPELRRYAPGGDLFGPLQEPFSPLRQPVSAENSTEPTGVWDREYYRESTNPRIMVPQAQTEIWDPTFSENITRPRIQVVTEVYSNRREGRKKKEPLELAFEEEEIFHLVEGMWLDASEAVKKKVCFFLDLPYHDMINPRVLLNPAIIAQLVKVEVDKKISLVFEDQMSFEGFLTKLVKLGDQLEHIKSMNTSETVVYKQPEPEPPMYLS